MNPDWILYLVFVIVYFIPGYWTIRPMFDNLQDKISRRKEKK